MYVITVQMEAETSSFLLLGPICTGAVLGLYWGTGAVLGLYWGCCTGAAGDGAGG